MKQRSRYRWEIVVGLCFCLTLLSRASGDTPATPDPLRDVDLHQNLGGHIPLDAAFTDDTGRRVTLHDYFGGKHPVVLVMAYYNCPMLCTLVLNGLAESLQQVPFDAGRDFEIVVVSIDPHETPTLAARKKKTYVSLYGRLNTAAGWHLLTGDEPNIRAVADAVGFKYVYDNVSHQYAHPAGIVMLTPDGTISRYFYGTAYAPLDMKLGLLDAGKGTIGTPVQEVLLRCFQYDPMTGRYGFAVMSALRVCAAATMAGLVGLVWVMSRRAKRQARAGNAVVKGAL